MKKLSAAEAQAIDALMPGNQNALVGELLKEIGDFGAFQFTTSIAAGSTGVITPVDLPSDPALLFDFEILDITVRTESAVASSTLQVKNGTNNVSDAIVSASLNALTRGGTINPAYNKFYPKSNPSGYASAKCNLVDASGATAAARTVTLWVRKI